MKRLTGNIGFLLTLLLPAIAISTKTAQAQLITPELDPNNNPITGTLVGPNLPNPNQLDITGGAQAGTNLFHSFEQFGLNAGQIANFIANPNIQNILGRVVGGNPSVINGLIQVTSSGTPNLFLMNPAGIIFGDNASLNIPADFTATTATSIGFGTNWFNATGVNDYTSLIATPNTFAFTTSQPGSIINSGNLTVSQGNLMLLGGTVASTGQLSAPGGQITIASVPGESLVNITQDGLLLSLEILQPLSSFPPDTPPGEWTLPISSLPELLTGGNARNATGLIVNNDGTISLTGSGLQLDADTGTVIVAGSLDGAEVRVEGTTIGVGDISSNGGNITFNADRNVSLAGNIISNGGDITLGFATLVNDVTISTGENVGGDITVNGIDSDSSTTPRNLTLAAGTGNVNLNGYLGDEQPLNSLSVSGSTITADFSPQAGLSDIATLGDLELQAQADLTLSGNLEAEGNLRLESQQGNLILTDSALQASGNIELLALNTVQIRDSVDTPLRQTGAFRTQAEGNLLIQGTQAIDIQALSNPLSWFLSNGNISLVSNGNITSNGRFASVGDFSINQVSGAPANFTTLSSNGIISALGDVSFGDYTGAALKVESTGSITARNITITEPNSSFLAGVNPNSPAFTNDPDIAFLANSPALILRAGLTELRNSPNIPPDLLGGATFTASGEPSSPGNISVGNINTNSGSVILSATGDITTGAITTGGGIIEAESFDRGFVNLSAGGDIEVQFIDTSDTDTTDVGGDITIAAAGLFRATGYIITGDRGAFWSPNDNEIVSGSALGSNIPTEAIPTSINAAGSRRGGDITIQHGGSSFVVGPTFETDPVTGNVVFRTIQRNDNGTIVLDADGNIVFGEQVFYTDANGNIEYNGGNTCCASDLVFRDSPVNGNEVDFSLVAPVSRVLTVADLMASDPTSFTAGAINTSNTNPGAAISFRNRPFTNNLATGDAERIQIRFAPPSNSGNGNPDAGGVPSNGGVLDSNETPNGGEPVISDSSTDNSGSGDAAIAPQIFEQHNERSPQQWQQLQVVNQCRSKPDEAAKKTAEISDRPDDEDCEELELISQPRLLCVESSLLADIQSQPNASLASCRESR